ncbi:hypothetical protein AVEN_136004-1 [Araneus ventricosus]|uniref:Uncharacterized protein n=1 Tax=Araneus ventricosus TaxID=182803 RepID=A0A4Y2MRL1_ARAVE|nr:hypothetical protein AVEN_136004-1 [Araneus ventricosus]
MEMYYPLAEHASAKTTWCVMTGSPESKNSSNTANVLLCSGSYSPGGIASTRIRCCRISKKELGSPGGIVKVGLKVPPPVIDVPPSRWVRPWPGDWLLGFRPRLLQRLSFR